MKIYLGASREWGTGENDNKQGHLKDHGVLLGMTNGCLGRKKQGVDMHNEYFNDCRNLETG